MRKLEKPGDVQVFKGFALFNKYYIWPYVHIMQPITKLMRKVEEYTQSKKCEEAWMEIKEWYQNAPIFITSRWDLEFEVYTNASNIVVGVMLLQNPIGKYGQSTRSLSRFLNSTKNYIIMKWEVLAMMYALNKNKHYLLGNKFIFYIDHMALIYLINKPSGSARITSYLVLFKEYDFSIICKPQNMLFKDYDFSIICKPWNMLPSGWRLV